MILVLIGIQPAAAALTTAERPAMEAAKRAKRLPISRVERERRTVPTTTEEKHRSNSDRMRSLLSSSMTTQPRISSSLRIGIRRKTNNYNHNKSGRKMMTYYYTLFALLAFTCALGANASIFSFSFSSSSPSNNSSDQPQTTTTTTTTTPAGK